MVVCLEQGADLHMAQLMPLPLTLSCFSKIQIGFTFLVLAHLGSPRKKAIKRGVCVYVTVRHLQAVLAANSDTLRTVAVRPHGIFGPRDPHMLPTTVRMARAGKTKFMIGSTTNTCFLLECSIFSS